MDCGDLVYINESGVSKTSSVISSNQTDRNTSKIEMDSSIEEIQVRLFAIKVKPNKKRCFWGEENNPHVTEAFQLLPRRHLFLHDNGKESLDTETGALE